MKNRISIAVVLVATMPLFSQVSGNMTHRGPVALPDNHIEINWPTNTDVQIKVKGLANLKPDTYVAVFSTSQMGKEVREINEAIDKRIAKSVTEIKQRKGAETYVDVISFVPVYDVAEDAKVFSKNTYNELPIGFEVRKNIHIRYSDPNALNDFITILADSEIYDLVKVDCFSSELEAVKKDLHLKARTLAMEKIKNDEAVLGEVMTPYEKWITDDYKVSLPVENYGSYAAYTNSSYLSSGKFGKRIEKPVTRFYQPISYKEFDFVVNPVVLDPVIQVMYEMKVVIHREKKPTPKADREYILITPSGEMKTLPLTR